MFLAPAGKRARPPAILAYVRTKFPKESDALLATLAWRQELTQSPEILARTEADGARPPAFLALILPRIR